MVPPLSPEADSVQEALAELIHDATQFIDESHWCCLPGECDSALCVHTMCSLQEFATLMHVAGLVQVGKHGMDFF
jgi:hypothetical protein